MKPSLVLHIGPMKTGSSAIQHWLVQSRDELMKAGVFVPRCFGANMSRLAHMAQQVHAGLKLGPRDARMFDELQSELAGLPGDVTTAVISGELLGTALKSPGKVAALKSILEPFFSDSRIIIYLRRQDEIAVSLYSTMLKRGNKDAELLTRMFDYEAALSAWAKVFGKEAITPRLYDRRELVDGDVVRDFADVAKLPYAPADEPIKRNLSLRPAAQEFLRLLAERMERQGAAADLTELDGYRRMRRVLDKEFAGSGALPSRAEALAKYATVKDANERVRAEWFPERPRLFDESFDGYPEEATPSPDSKQILDVALAIAALALEKRSPQRKT